MKTLQEIYNTAEADSITRLIIDDAGGADGEESLDYIRTIAENGCGGGSCSGLIYYRDTHAFTAKYCDEINEIINDMTDELGYSPLDDAKTNGDLFNWLAWFSYEVKAQEIIRELE